MRRATLGGTARVVGLLALLAVLAVACSGKGPSAGFTGGAGTTQATAVTGQQEAYVNALQHMLQAAVTTQGATLDATTSTCIARRWTLILNLGHGKRTIAPNTITSTAALAKLQVTKAEGERLVDAMGECGYDWKREIFQSGGTTRLTDAQVACLDQHLSTDVLREVLADSIAGHIDVDVQRQFAIELTPAEQACGVDLTQTSS